jgi:MYXO-CTERM domain-containing protein
VSISGAIAIVGAPFHKVGTNTAAGSAYVFADVVTGWSQQEELTAGDAAASDNYGTSVAVSVSGSTAAAIVGAPNHASSSQANSGAAYVYVQSGTTWPLQQEANAFTDGENDGAAGDAFGTSVSVSVAASGSATASVAIVGAPYHTAAGSPNEAGAAYTFAQSGTTWPYQQELSAPTSGANAGAAFDAFGTSVSVSGATAFVGAPNHAVSSHDEAGSAYVFAQGNTAAWSLSQMLVASDPAIGAQFGSSVSVSGTNAIVGSYLHDAVGAADAGVEDEGTAYVFFFCSTWSQQQELQEATGSSFTTPAPSDFFGYSVSISGSNALVGAYGVMVGANASAGGSYVFDGTGCCISSSVYNSGTTNPSDSCEVCTPATSTTAWSDEPTGTSCNSGTEVCSATGTCIDDCYIGTTLYPAGTVNSTNACQVCTPGTSISAWSNEPAGTTCNSGTEVCSAGACVDDCYIGTTLYAAGTVNSANACQVCTPATLTSNWSNEPTGTSCDSGKEVCSAGACIDDCYIAGTLYAAGTVDSANTCQVCTPATSISGWSNQTNGTTCTGGACLSGVCVAEGVDAGSSDAGSGEHDAGASDAGSSEHDAGAADAGSGEHDAGAADAGSGGHDAGTPIDSGIADSGTGGNDASAPVDSGAADGAAPTDASTGEDAGPVSSEDSGTSVGEDGGTEDGGFVVGSEDSGVSNGEDGSTGNGGVGKVGEGGGCGCTVVGNTHDTHALFGAVGLVLVAARRRRRRQAARARTSE